MINLVKKYLYIFIAVILFPFLIYLESPIGIIANNNQGDILSYFGSIIGGLTTLIGVFITIDYYKRSQVTPILTIPTERIVFYKYSDDESLLQKRLNNFYGLQNNLDPFGSISILLMNVQSSIITISNISITSRQEDKELFNFKLSNTSMQLSPNSSINLEIQVLAKSEVSYNSEKVYFALLEIVFELSTNNSAKSKQRIASDIFYQQNNVIIKSVTPRMFHETN